MNPFDLPRYSHREMIRDAFTILTPAILTLGILWFFWNDLLVP